MGADFDDPASGEASDCNSLKCRACPKWNGSCTPLARLDPLLQDWPKPVSHSRRRRPVRTVLP